ncbi:alpha/beta hydrolase [Pseudoxanthomonas sp. LjRoot125]|uniref:alpha/beta hydrolase n=1 Tax=Pseudoxanthomonas sp. LjRoot125 TaxID=3342258 RepID=UPI003E122A2C
MMKLLLVGTLLVVLVLMVVNFVTSWPSVLVIRYEFDKGAENASAALAPKVPTSIKAQSGSSYDPMEPDAVLDIYRGTGDAADGPTIVWFHGGGFVSGSRQDVANYPKILAGEEFTVVNVDYTIAPEATYPTPIRQANKALAYVAANCSSLGLNANKLVPAGDSAGEQIAAQTAAMISNADHACALGIASARACMGIGSRVPCCTAASMT